MESSLARGLLLTKPVMNWPDYFEEIHISVSSVRSESARERDDTCFSANTLIFTYNAVEKYSTFINICSTRIKTEPSPPVANCCGYILSVRIGDE